jgi:hypothetical protein
MMQHIAISDLSISILHILPAAISLIAGHWVLGESLCFAKPYVAYWIYPSGMCLICALITSKFLILRFPMRARGWREKHAHIVCGTIWAFGLGYPLLFYIIDPRDVFFDYRTYGCDYHFQAEVWKKIQPVTFTITALAPNLIIIGTSIPVLIIARKAARARQSSVNLRGVVTVVVTAAVYLISTLPGTVYFLAASHVSTDSVIHFHLYRIGIFMGMINVMSNFFIYSLTIESFREFWVKKLHLPFGKSSMNIISPELERGELFFIENNFQISIPNFQIHF